MRRREFQNEGLISKLERKFNVKQKDSCCDHMTIGQGSTSRIALFESTQELLNELEEHEEKV